MQREFHTKTKTKQKTAAKIRYQLHGGLLSAVFCNRPVDNPLLFPAEIIDDAFCALCH